MMNHDEQPGIPRGNQQVFNALQRAKKVIDRGNSMNVSLELSLEKPMPDYGGILQTTRKEEMSKQDDDSSHIEKIKELNETMTELLEEKDELLADALGLVDENEDLAFQLEERSRECRRLQDENQSLRAKLEDCRMDLERMSRIEESKSDIWKVSDYEAAVGAINKGMQRKIRGIESEKDELARLMKQYQDEAEAAQEAACVAVDENAIMKKIISGCSSCRSKHKEGCSHSGSTSKHGKNSMLSKIRAGRSDSASSDEKSPQVIKRSVSKDSQEQGRPPMLKTMSDHLVVPKVNILQKEESPPRPSSNRHGWFTENTKLQDSQEIQFSEPAEEVVTPRRKSRPRGYTDSKLKNSRELSEPEFSLDSKTTASSTTYTMSPKSTRRRTKSTSKDQVWCEESGSTQGKISLLSCKSEGDGWFQERHEEEHCDSNSVTSFGRRASAIGVMPQNMSKRLSRSRFGQTKAGKMLLS